MEESFHPPTPADVVPNEHLAFLDGARAIAALYVLLHHTFLQVWPIDYGITPVGITATLTNWMLYGHFPVDVFIVISGFCLMLPVVRGGSMRLRGGVLRFYARRTLRIVPTFYAGLGLSVLLIHMYIGKLTHTHWDCALPIPPHGILSNLLLLQDVWLAGKINHTFWSVAVEWRIYLLFPLMVWGWRKIGGVAVTVVSTVVFVAAALAVRGWGPYGLSLSNSNPQYVALFAMGMFAAAAVFGPDRLPLWIGRQLGRAWPALLPIGYVAYYCHRHEFFQTTTEFLWLDLLVGLTTAMVLAHCALRSAARVRRWLAWRPLVLLGTFAYSIYLVHAPLLQVFWQLVILPLKLRNRAALLAALVVGWPCILAGAYLFFLLFERPFMSRRLRAAATAEQRAALTASCAAAPDVVPAV